jgi:YYY domain-containing protein
MLETLLWWILLELIGLAVFPISFRFFRNLPDRGYTFIKPLGLLLIVYPFWLLTSLGFLTNTQGSIALVALVVAGASWFFVAWMSPARWQQHDTRAPASVDRSHPPLRDGGANEPNGGDEPVEHEKRTIAGPQPADPAHPGGIEVPPTSSPEATRRSRKSKTPASAGGDEPRAGVETHDFSETLAVAECNLSPIDWLRTHVRLVITTELVFTVAFVGWALVRAFMPDITATEKPMDFAFLNGILQSRQFPPLDPWLSGYAISYYYFGYLIIAMLTMLSGVASSIAYNLAIALAFALAATGAFGLAYDLIAGAQDVTRIPPRGQAALEGTRALFFSLFAPIFLVVMGNLEGLLEALHARGLGSVALWNWVDVKGLVQAPVTGTFVPTDNWWWWRASRVIHDVAQGQTQEVIDEFPQFSFLLGDMHPHVLALPFAFLALAIGLKLFRETKFNLKEAWPEFLLIALVIGALPPLNFWDVLPYGFIAVVAFAAARYRFRNRWEPGATRDVVQFAVALGVAGIVLYLPFYLGFQSQAGGLLPVLFVKTSLHQYLLMFGLFIFVFVVFLARLVYEHRSELAHVAVGYTLPVVALLVAFPVAIAAFALALLAISAPLREQALAAFPNAPGNVMSNVLSAYFGPLFADPWLYLLLVLLLASVVGLLRLRIIDLALFDTSTNFVLLMMFTGLLLTFGAEFVYLRDVFGTRMNTVFKFYYQVWALFSVAAAYGVYYVAQKSSGIARGAWFAGLAVLLLASLIYPALAIPSRVNEFTGTPTLDGIAWIKRFNPSDYAGIQWLDQNAPRGSVILEATGDEYSYGNRISMATGLPTVLGWYGHENQWRGNTNLFKNDAKGIDRAADIARIYQTLDPNEALTLMGKYDISFVVVGDTERVKYGLSAPQIDKFSKAMPLAFQNGNLRIYARPNLAN